MTTSPRSAAHSATSAMLVGCGFAAAFALGWFVRGKNLSPVAITAAQPVAAPTTVAAVRPVAAAPASEIVPSVPAALAAVHAGPTKAARLFAFAVQLNRLPTAEYPALLRALLLAPSRERPEQLAMLFDRWAQHAGPAAFAAARELAARDGEHGALHAAIAGWASRDPQAASAGLRDAGYTNLASDEMSSLLQGWAVNDAAAAERYLQSVAGPDSAAAANPPAAVQRGYEAIARARVAAAPSEALAWYRGLGEPLQERLRQAMIAELSAAQPALASRWLAEDPSTQLGASDLTTLLRASHFDSLDAQFAWARTAANPLTRESALVAVVREGADANMVGLGEWLAARSDDAGLAPAFAAYAAQVVRKSPNAAVTWAASVDDPSLRQRALDAVAREWNGLDPRAAHQWATQSGLVDWNTIMR